MGLVEEASWVSHKIGILPAVPVCNALLNRLVKKGMFESMWQFHTDMLSRGMVSNFVTYGVLIDGCCGQCDVLKACSLFDEMIEKGIEPTVVIYTILIRGLCNESQMTEPENIFKLMREIQVCFLMSTLTVL
ncbi:hypothetical protein Q3G72_027393 [Acer saccharum]|nr:hypothetical protein Q3G72_011760 [Acer saccharum]KAK1572079.1 hypothetical protein Q3G72_027393 [Acer saccharum]